MALIRTGKGISYGNKMVAVNSRLRLPSFDEWESHSYFLTPSVGVSWEKQQLSKGPWCVRRNKQNYLVSGRMLLIKEV